MLIIQILFYINHIGSVSVQHLWMTPFLIESILLLLLFYHKFSALLITLGKHFEWMGEGFLLSCGCVIYITADYWYILIQYNEYNMRFMSMIKYIINYMHYTLVFHVLVTIGSGYSVTWECIFCPLIQDTSHRLYHAINRFFGLISRPWDYLPMAMVILCGRSQVRYSAVAL